MNPARLQQIAPQRLELERRLETHWAMQEIHHFPEGADARESRRLTSPDRPADHRLEASPTEAAADRSAASVSPGVEDVS